MLIVTAGQGAATAHSDSGVSSPFPRALRQFGSYLGLLLLRVAHITPLDCISSHPAVISVVLTLALPLILVALVVFAALLLRVVRTYTTAPLTWRAAYRRAVKASLVLLVVVYPLTSVELLAAFYHRKCGWMYDSVGVSAG